MDGTIMVAIISVSILVLTVLPRILSLFVPKSVIFWFKKWDNRLDIVIGTALIGFTTVILGTVLYSSVINGPINIDATRYNESEIEAVALAIFLFLFILYTTFQWYLLRGGRDD